MFNVVMYIKSKVENITGVKLVIKRLLRNVSSIITQTSLGIC
ncbi:hypothetical protein TcasGA2_TC033020 [Tribolium castaneum]|uniref:Uncharacterized protein n=1 Tax=Tribolium castaneum TaxID=7070 RepID=A0A139WIB8_TRICA|nr:hypothetical protein TcasGA2_TC033020 [Tribolium castaneum]